MATIIGRTRTEGGCGSCLLVVIGSVLILFGIGFALTLVGIVIGVVLILLGVGAIIVASQTGGGGGALECSDCGGAVSRRDLQLCPHCNRPFDRDPDLLHARWKDYVRTLPEASRADVRADMSEAEQAAFDRGVRDLEREAEEAKRRLTLTLGFVGVLVAVVLVVSALGMGLEFVDSAMAWARGLVSKGD